MNEQLSVFTACSDSDPVSLQNSRSDAKSRAIQRYLNDGKPEPSICVNTYSPGRRTTEYYRLSYQWRGRKKHIHIRGGSTIAELSTYRAGKLTEMIDRGAELAEILAAVRTFNGGSS